MGLHGGVSISRPLVVLLLAGFLVSLSGPLVTTSPATAASVPCELAIDGSLVGSAVVEANACVVALKSGSGNWLVPAGVGSISYLIVGGGGGSGAGFNAGGGGAGGFTEVRSVSVTPGTSLPATVGTGGERGTNNTATGVGTAGSPGQPSAFHIDSAGGGGGGSTMAGRNSGELVPGVSILSNVSGYGGSGGGTVADPAGAPKVTNSASGTSTALQKPVSGLPAGSGPGLRHKGGDTGAVFVYFPDATWSHTGGSPSGTGLSVSIWLGSGGGGAGGPGGDISWSSPGTASGTSFDPGAGGPGRASALLTKATAGVLAVGGTNPSGTDDLAFFAGGGAGNGNFDSVSSEPKTWQWNLISYRLGASSGIAGRAGTGDTLTHSGTGGRDGAGKDGVIIIRYSLTPGAEPGIIDGFPEEEPAAEESSGESESSEEGRRSQASGIGLDLLGEVGGVAESSKIEAGGVKLPAGTVYTLTFLRPETALVTDQVGDSGSFYHLVHVPGPLAPGTYSIVLRAVQPDGFVLELRRDFVVAGDGTIIDLGTNVVGGGPAKTGPDPSRLQTTGEESEGIPWWALMLQLLGLVLVVYSIRATRMVDTEDLSDVVAAVRTPWEILSTPITVPGIDYLPGSQGTQVAPTFADTMRELDLAVSKVIAFEIKKLRYHAAVRVIAPVRSWSHLD